MSLKRFILALTLVGLAGSATAEVVVFVDGTRMSVQRYEVKGNVVVLTTEDGKLRSVPRDTINLEATERLNRPAQASPPLAPASPSPPPSPPLPEPETKAQAPEVPAPPVASEDDLPPTVWTHDELGLSLVIPSPAWQVQDMVASFDVAVQLEKQEGEARATLALIRRPMRSYQDFRAVLEETESSASATLGYRSLGSEPLDVGPYTAHELRFIKQIGDLPIYNRIVAYYSQDLAYVFSLSCPESRLAENQEDFDALVRGLVIKKSQAELTPDGKPES